jgi:hypothetical protein
MKATTRGDPTLCQYAQSQPKDHPTTKNNTDKEMKRTLKEIEDRVRRLEELEKSIQAGGDQQQRDTGPWDDNRLAKWYDASKSALDDSGTTSRASPTSSYVRPGRRSFSRVNTTDVPNHRPQMLLDSHWDAIIADIVVVRKYFTSHEHARNASVAIRAVIEQLKSCDQGLRNACSHLSKSDPNHPSPISAPPQQNIFSSYDNHFIDTHPCDDNPRILPTSLDGIPQGMLDNQLTTRTSHVTCELPAISTNRHQTERTGLKAPLDVRHDYHSHNERPLDFIPGLTGGTENVFGDMYHLDDWVRSSPDTILNARYLDLSKLTGAFKQDEAVAHGSCDLDLF